MSTYTTKSAKMETSAPLIPLETSIEQPDQPPMYWCAPASQAQYQPDANEEQQHPYATPASAPTQAQAQAQAPVAAYKPTVLQPDQPIPSGASVVYMQAPTQAPMHAPDSRLENVGDCVGLGIFTTLCCSTAFGLLAVVYGFRVRDAKRRNDYREAKAARKTMIRMNTIGIVLGVVLITFTIYRVGTLLSTYGKTSTSYSYTG